MRRKSAAVLFVLAVVGLCPGSAMAECAWMLWTETTEVDSTANTKVLWTWRSAHETAAACRTNRYSMVSEVIVSVRGHARRDSAGNPLIAVRSSDKDMYFKYHCLPDTIDPRGVKGK
jgi:hypothetical protein